jgi:hypothetical protein
MFSEFQAHITEAESQIHSLLKVAMGSEKDSEDVQKEVDTCLSISLFQKEHLSEYDDRTKSFICWFLEFAEEGGQMEIKDLIDRAKIPGFGEKFVRDLRETVFQPSAWPKGARFIIGFHWK